MVGRYIVEEGEEASVVASGEPGRGGASEELGRGDIKLDLLDRIEGKRAS